MAGKGLGVMQMPIYAPNFESLIANLEETNNLFWTSEELRRFERPFTVISGKQVRSFLEQAIGKLKEDSIAKIRPRDYVWVVERPEPDYVQTNYIQLSTTTYFPYYYYHIYRVGNDQFVVLEHAISRGLMYTYDAAGSFGNEPEVERKEDPEEERKVFGFVRALRRLFK